VIVLDYLKKTVDNSIVIPPFHTGHLGLIPKTPVWVGRTDFGPENEQHCEVLITPYYPSSDLAYVHCIMRDEPGVVERLLEAVSCLGINVVTEESSAINGLEHHSVSLIIDLCRSHYRRGEKSDDVQRARYREWQTLFPCEERRYVILFESIIAHCASVLVWDEHPSLIIRPLTLPNVQFKLAEVKEIEQKPELATKPLTKEGEGGKKASYHVKIELPAVLQQIRERFGILRPAEALTYLLGSQMEERLLRVFFPNPQIVDRIIHLGIRHSDMPGALTALTQLLASEKFNILTSLLRSLSPQGNVWEAILEYRGTKTLPPPPGQSGSSGRRTATREQCEWVAHRLQAGAAKNMVNLTRYNFKVGLPLYPKPNANWDGFEVKSEQGASAGRTASDAGRTASDLGIVNDRAMKELATLDGGGGSRSHNRPSSSGEDSKAVSALRAVVQGSTERRKRLVFISYPRQGAARHAKLLKEALDREADFEGYMYDAQGAEPLVETICQRIREADYFVGIWHPDTNQPIGLGKFGISPWIPFEYGIAKTLEKRRIMVVHSEQLANEIWDRITRDIANKAYNDLEFAQKTVGEIVEQCRKWLLP
jgi:hypothetical protein